jgi:hypothetical protein
VAAELLRRHHKALATHAARHGKRGTIAAARATGKGGRSLAAWLAAKAARRWQARGQAAPLFLIRRRPDAADDGAAERAARREAERQQRLATGQPAAVITAATGSHDPAGAPAPASTLGRSSPSWGGGEAPACGNVR